MKVLFGDTIFYAFDLRRGSLFTWSWRSREDPEDLAAFILCKKESFSLRPAQGFDFKTLSIESGIEAASLQLCGQALYRLRLAVEKMYFQQGKDQPWTLGMNLICTVPRPHLPGLTLKFGYIASLSKSAGFISLAGRAWLVSISDAILFLPSQNVYLPLEFEFRWKSCVGKGAWRPRYLLMPHIYLVYYIVWRVNLIKLSLENSFEH